MGGFEYPPTILSNLGMNSSTWRGAQNLEIGKAQFWPQNVCVPAIATPKFSYYWESAFLWEFSWKKIWRELLCRTPYHCTPLLLSHLTGWLLCHLSLYRPLVILSLLCSLVVLRRMVVASPLVALHSCALVVPPLILLSSSHCTALSSSHCTGWLLHCLLLHCPLVVLSLHHPLVVLLQLVVALPLLSPHSCPLVVLPSHPLVVLSLHCLLVVLLRWLIVASPLVILPSCCPLTPTLSRHLAPAGCCVTSCRATHLSSCCATLSSSHCLFTVLPSHCLIAPAGSCVTSCGIPLLLSSHCAALLLSCSGWLLCCLLLRRPLVLSSCCPLVLLLCTGWLLHGLHQRMPPPLNAPTTTATSAATSIAAVTTTAATAATATTATATTIVELSIVHCLRKRQQQQHHHQHTNGSANVKTFTSPHNLGLFNLSTVFELVE